MSNLVAAPVLLPLATALLLVPLVGRERAQHRLALASGVLLAAAAAWIVARTAAGEVLVLPLGGWDPRVGIVWVADSLAAVMLALAATVSLAMLVYVPASFRGARESRYFYPLHQFLMAGVNASFVTGDLFNLFVAFEIMLLSSFVLISMGARRRQLRAAFPYVVVNLVGSALFLAGTGAVYGTAGTVNLAEISRRAASGGLPPAFWAAIGLVLVVFALKTALVPLFFWLPDAYPHAPIAISGLFAGLLTKVGVYTLFRVVPLVGGPQGGRIQELLLVLAGATMLLGVLGALGRSGIREILSFHIVSQVGYMVFGLALFTPLAVAAGIFYVVHHIVVKTALFFAGGIAERVGGSGALGAVRGLGRTHPWVAVGFFVPAMALAGLPPFSGFWGKFFLVVAGYQAGAWAATTISLVVGLLTLASMLKIWTAVFWGAPEGARAPALGRDPGMLSATLALAGVSVAIGLLAAPLLAYSEQAAAQLLAVSPYVDAVLAGGR
ncbi:MAG: proton-conducting transporter membrane subunit [Gemmatimonadota bacterium]